MILTVTLNPALDITHVVDALEPGASHRVAAVHDKPGGKGLNVARVLHQLGHPVLATGLLGGATGQEVRDALAREGVPGAFHRDPGVSTRRSLTIVERASGRATVSNERGPSAADWPALRAHVAGLMADADLVVLSGSLPPALPADAYRVLVDDAHRRGVPAVLDADGAALTGALPACPDLVKPNTAELRAATGCARPAAGRRLLAAGAARVVVSDGPRGLFGFDAAEAWRAVPVPLVPVNPTGAGDAAVAALAVGLLGHRAWPDLLRAAVAWSAAAVLEPFAGRVAADRLDELAATTDVTALPSDVPGRAAPC